MSDTLDRRTFLTGPVLAAAVATTAVAQDKPAEKKKDGDEPKPPSPLDVSLLLAVVTYPDRRLDEAALGEIRGDLQQHLARSAVLSSFPLSNSDEPGFHFAAYRKD